MKHRKIAGAVLFFVLLLGSFFVMNWDSGYAANQTGTVIVDSALNVRSGAGKNYGVIDSLSNGAKVTILNTDGGWYQISYTKSDGTAGTGYVSATYVALDSAATATPTPTPTAAPQTVVSYRTETTYLPISVPATTSKKIKVYKKAGGSYLTVSKKSVILAKGKKVT
ncbi:MAG: SH3 domain-containing protein, partial [Eubacterium sp.]|nr:SH3 domain-containing protein [Eubacterium sp.]